MSTIARQQTPNRRSRSVRPAARRLTLTAGDVITIVTINAALVVAMWVRHGALNQLSSSSAKLTAAGQIDWRIGIRHPGDASALAAVLHVTDLAVATSGNYERGDHILDARTRMPHGELVSMTVAGRSLAQADAYATIGFAMGNAGVAWVATRPGYSPYAVTSEGRVQYADQIAELLANDDRG